MLILTQIVVSAFQIIVVEMILLLIIVYALLAVILVAFGLTLCIFVLNARRRQKIFSLLFLDVAPYEAFLIFNLK